MLATFPGRPLLSALILGLSLSACASTEPPEPFPAAPEGQQRHVIDLPALADENAHRVELIAGRMMEVDCNVHHLGGHWRGRTVAGWGYSYIELDQVGPAISTMMACPEDSRQTAFVAVGGEPHLVRYNSKLPLVIYTPQDIEVRYRIWSAGSETLPATQR
ncbi:MAG: serine protease inhibitor ecotin [Thauera sp.]|jgi:ecotin|nr:serine protease inhibitor ecotin [Thauera sp.]